MARAFDRRRTPYWAVCFAALGTILLIGTGVGTAGASSTDIGGYYGDPATDGSVSCDQCPGGSPAINGQLPFPSFAETGLHTMALTATDDAVLSGRHAAAATVAAATSTAIGALADSPPSAEAGGPYSGTVGEPISFDGSGSSGADGASLTYSWSFGDGWTAEVESPTHSYSIPGTFIAQLVVTNDALQSGSDVALVTIAAVPTTTTEAPSVGGGIYETNCAGCHGGSGEGGVGPSLQDSTLSTAEIDSITTNGAGSMPGYADSLSAEEISEVSSYAKGLQGGTTSTPPATTEAPSGGGGIYETNCAGCHGGSGEGGVGPSLQDSTLSTAEIDSITTNGAGSMPGYADSLSAEEISAVSSYVKDLQGGTTSTTPPGNNELYTTQCAGCHGADGEGGLGPPLQTSTMGLDDIESTIADGLGTMPGYAAALSAEEIGELAAFTLGLQGAATTEPPTGGGEGAELFAIHCAACHGTQGEGGIGPALAGTSLSASEIAAVVNAGRGVMPSFSAVLSAEQINAIAGFVATVGDGGDGQPGDPAVSEETAARYATLCAACHGDGGQGTPAGPALTESAMSQDELVVVITEGRGAMPGYADQLSAQEIEDLAVLIGTMRQGQGGGDEPATTTTTLPAPPTTTAFGVTSPADDGDAGEAPGRILAIVLLVAIAAGGGYLIFASRRTRSR